eukprot:3196201-Amphidinium_carterae.1
MSLLCMWCVSARPERIEQRGWVYFELRRVLDGIFKKAADVKSVLKAEKTKWDKFMSDLGIAEKYPASMYASGSFVNFCVWLDLSIGVMIAALLSAARARTCIVAVCGSPKV